MRGGTLPDGFALKRRLVVSKKYLLGFRPLPIATAR
jgi:hypothetical protein